MTIGKLGKSPNKFLAPLLGTWVIHLVLSDLNFQFDRLFSFVNFFWFCINSLSYFSYLLSYPNFVRGQLFVDMRIFAGHAELLKGNCRVIRKVSQCFERK